MTWGWRSKRSSARERFGGLSWLQPLAIAVPWVTVGLLMMMMHVVGGAITSREGVLFDLPSGGYGDASDAKLVALVMPMPKEARGTLVFFDDARYTVGDDSSLAAFAEQLADRASKTEGRTLLVLADRRVPGGDLMTLAEVARKSGIARLLFAEKKSEVE